VTTDATALSTLCHYATAGQFFFPQDLLRIGHVVWPLGNSPVQSHIVLHNSSVCKKRESIVYVRRLWPIRDSCHTSLSYLIGALKK
jgi:hypothetical protein